MKYVSLFSIFIRSCFFFLVSSCLFNLNAEDYSYQDSLKAEGVIVDVRELNEVQEGIISGAQWIALSQMKQDPESTILAVEKLSGEKRLFLYCRSGNRVKQFMKYLEGSNVEAINLGGYDGLVKKGFPTAEFSQE